MRKSVVYIGLLGISIIVLLAGGLSVLLLTLPSEKELRGCMTTELFQVHLCPGSKSYVRLSQIPMALQKAIILSEDSAFYSHDGFDWAEIEKSFETNLKRGKFARGGSTITQQLAKNMFLTKDKTLWRKFREALITSKIEQTLKKGEILERYLNVVQFGPKIYGVKKASQFYFNKSPSDLSINESVFLAFVLPSPDKYSHSYFRKELTRFARTRMHHILTLMVKTGKISEVEYNESIAGLDYFPATPPSPPEVDIESTEEVPTLEDLENE